MRWLKLNLIIFLCRSWLFSTPLLLLEVHVVYVILGFNINFLGYTGSNFCESFASKFHLPPVITSSVIENGYNSPHSSPRALVALLPLTLCWFCLHSLATNHLPPTLCMGKVTVSPVCTHLLPHPHMACLPCTYLSLDFFFCFLFLLLAFPFFS